MADRVLELIIKTEVEKALKDLKKVDNTTSNTKKGFEGLKKAAGFAVGAFTAVAAAAATVGAAALKASADFEKQKVAFEVMLGSAGKAQTLLEEIEKFSATTPFQMPGLVDGTKRLIAFGIAEGEVLGKMKNLGNAAQGNQETLGRLVDAYGKLRAKGKASLEELNRFTEAGVPIVDELAKQYGVSTGELLKMVSAGKIGFKDVDQALTTLTTGTGRFAGMIKKQSQTLQGLFSTFQDNIGLILKDIGDEMAPIAKKALGGATKFLQENRENIVAIFRRLPEVASLTFGLITKIIKKTFSWETLSTGISAIFQGFVRQAQISIGAIPKMFSNIIEIIGAPFQAIGEFMMSVFRNAFENVKLVGAKALNFIIDRINDVLKGVDALTFWAEQDIAFVARVEEIDPTPIKDFGNVWDKQIDEAGQAISNLVEITGGALNASKDNWLAVGGAIGETYKDVVSDYQMQLGELLDSEKEKMKAEKEANKESLDKQTEDRKEKTKAEIELEKKKNAALLELYGTEEEKFISSVENQAAKYKELLGGQFDDVKWIEDQKAEYKKEKEEEAFEFAVEKAQAYMNITNDVLSSLGASYAQYFKNINTGIDNKEKKELKAIEAEYEANKESLKKQNLDEETLKSSLESLEQSYASSKEGINKQYEEKRKQAKRDEFIGEKTAAVIKSVIDTATAVTEVLPNIPLSILMGALGAVQTGLIAAQPIPAFAQGGSFFTSGPQMFGGAMVGDNVGGVEKVTVEPVSSFGEDEGNLVEQPIIIKIDSGPIYRGMLRASKDRILLIDKGALV